MSYISKITLPNGVEYDIKDIEARELIAGAVSFYISWDGHSIPNISIIPNGIKVIHNGQTYEGTLSAETQDDPLHPEALHAKIGTFYLVYTSNASHNSFAEYVPVGQDGSKYWEKVGDADIDLSEYAKKGDGITGNALNTVTGISLSSHDVTNTDIESYGLYTPVSHPVLSSSTSSDSVQVSIGGVNSSSSVTFSGSTDVYSMTSSGSVTPGVANIPTAIDVTKFNGGNFVQGSKAVWTGTVSNELLTIDWTSNGNDSFTKASLNTGFYSAGTANSPTLVSLPTRSSAINTLTTSTTATAAAQNFTPTIKYLSIEGEQDTISVTGRSNVSIANHTVTDNGHTHNVTGIINS